MKQLTLIIDKFDIVEVSSDKEMHEFKDYLRSLKGIMKVDIKNEDFITINICYDEKIITDNIIYLEISSFLNIAKVPALIAFDRHPKGKTKTYKIESNICCEYCFKIAVEDLFDISDILKVNSNYINHYYNHETTKEDKDTLTIYYDPKVITVTRMKEIEKELNI